MTATDAKTDGWEYTGDINLEHGGMFYRGAIDEGYADVVRVTDLDSGCGFSGAVLVEECTAIFATAPGDCHYANTQSALDCIGLDKTPETCTIHELVEAAMAYGLYDPATNYARPVSHVFQCDDDGPMAFDGWKADDRMDIDAVKDWIESELLD